MVRLLVFSRYEWHSDPDSVFYILNVYNVCFSHSFRVHDVHAVVPTFFSSNDIAVRHTPLTAILHPIYASPSATLELTVSSTPSPMDPSHCIILGFILRASTTPISWRFHREDVVANNVYLMFMLRFRMQSCDTSTIPENMDLACFDIIVLW